MILEKVANTKDPAEQKLLMKKWNEKQREAVKLDVRRDNERAERENPRQTPQQMNQRDTAIWVALEADYPVMADAGKKGKEFRAQTDLHLNVLLASGKPDNLTTFRAAAAAAARDLKIGGQSPVSSGQRGAFGGYANGDGGGGSGSNGRPTLEVGPQRGAGARARIAQATDVAGRGDRGLAQKVGPRVAKRMSER
jgi:hypothetical protein